MDPKDAHHLRKLIRELKNCRGRHTELVSVYVPAGYDLNNVMSQILQEQGTATNIKSTNTRKNVTTALEKTVQHLRLFKQTPKNGLAVFCGNVSEREGVPDFKIWSIEPPEPITNRIYRCDQIFITEPLEQLVAPKDAYGLIAMDNKEATIATLKGDNYIIHKRLTSGYSGKQRAGGQSAMRFARIVEEQSHEFKKRIGDAATEVFLPAIKDIRGLIVGGPAATKEEFLEGDYLHHEIKKKILAVKDITYTDESGIRELIDASSDDLKEVELIRHRVGMQRFLKILVKDGPVAYGADVETALAANAIDTLFISEALPDEQIDDLYERAKATGATVEILDETSEEGSQLHKSFQGKAAILRYKIN
ncbi:Peptide chain release factor subunit 1 [uncultured archaeon]|nr:Peptide chain release factor subunit 1 [uncultured archaeon]